MRCSDPDRLLTVRRDKGMDHYMVDIAFNRHCEKMLKAGVYKKMPRVSSTQLDPEFFPYVKRLIAKGML